MWVALKLSLGLLGLLLFVVVLREVYGPTRCFLYAPLAAISIDGK